MIVRCTEKLLKSLGVKPVEDVTPSSWLESWHAKSVRIYRVNCVVACNDETLYTVFISHQYCRCRLTTLPWILTLSTG